MTTIPGASADSLMAFVEEAHVATLPESGIPAGDSLLDYSGNHAVGCRAGELQNGDPGCPCVVGSRDFRVLRVALHAGLKKKDLTDSATQPDQFVVPH